MLSNVPRNGTTGVELGGTISSERPHTKVLLMSGFSGGLLMLNDGWHFLHKPFIPSQLRDLIATALHQPDIPDLDEHRKRQVEF